jgi:hypothetical protein
MRIRLTDFVELGLECDGLDERKCCSTKVEILVTQGSSTTIYVVEGVVKASV